ncbi:maleylpyruvate isomerase N-terminal domain-containing protein [Micromonospora sp. DR5-3]|uniref:maleylpyruvate isomerase N-terminal domain-containing protein n=1 Tax=unclassified Micromonospora TaxID=2617518 RepID=UPI0011D53F9F|nr:MULTISPECIES: maleylpyruvate isomerase N-terminal domain-containing protein [unclassified Micromonospora]MCW3813863.1 maleylpyruvate isomerase N-terminal domain-containing protein [Micromonospora sp. DR5-3]TYC25462.1 maleylpyruvate isomerase family protein [Micromonospora sp. MP36]
MKPGGQHIALAQAYDGITRTVADLDDADLQRPTRCRGWLVADLLFHVLCDAQRALVTLASPADGPADVDDVSYWRAFTPGGDDEASVRHAQWVRRSAAAFDRPSGVVRLWRDTAPAAVRAAGSAVPIAEPHDCVTTQGHVLRVPDFLATLTTEAVIHHLDMVVELPDAPAPGAVAVDVAVATVDGLLSDDAVRPTGWDDREYLLKATGRIPLTDRDRRELGEVAGWFPLLG